MTLLSRVNILTIIAVPLCAGCLILHSAPVFAHPFSEKPVTHEQVVESFRKMADENPDDVEMQYEYARTLLNADRLDDARAVLAERVLAREPEHGLGNFLMFEALYREGKYRESLKSLGRIRDKALEADVHAAEASAWLALKKPGKALKCAEAAVKLDVNNAEGYFQAGLALVELGKTKAAVAKLEKSLDITMDREEVYAVLKALYKKSLKPAEMMKKLKGIAERDGDGGEFSELVAQDIAELEKQVDDKRKK